MPGWFCQCFPRPQALTWRCFTEPIDAQCHTGSAGGPVQASEVQQVCSLRFGLGSTSSICRLNRPCSHSSRLASGVPRRSRPCSRCGWSSRSGLRSEMAFEVRSKCLRFMNKCSPRGISCSRLSDNSSDVRARYRIADRSRQ